LFWQLQKFRKSDSAIREENQGTRKPRERQIANEMRDSAKLKAESQVFLIINRLCMHPLDCFEAELKVKILLDFPGIVYRVSPF